MFLPDSRGPRWPVILHRTPYGITAAGVRDKTDCTKAWLPSEQEPMRSSILRGRRNIAAPAARGAALTFKEGAGWPSSC